MDGGSNTEQKHGRSTVLGKELFSGFMSPERVSVGEEGEGHSMQTNRKQKRRGNQQWVECLVRDVFTKSTLSGNNRTVLETSNTET